MAREICGLLRQRLAILVTLICLAAASGSHVNTNSPPPPPPPPPCVAEASGSHVNTNSPPPPPPLPPTCVAEASSSHGTTNSPPPPRMVDEYFVGQHQAREENLDALIDRRLDHMESLMKEQMKNSEQMMKNSEQMMKNSEQMMKNNEQMMKNNEQMMKNNEQMTKNSEQMTKNSEQMHKVLQRMQSKQKLQEMKSNFWKTKYRYEHLRQEAAGQAQTMDEGTGPTYELRFHGSLKSRIYTNKPLLDQSDGRIEITIYRDGQIITSGHLSSVRVEIVALDRDHSCKGSWTKEDFDRQIQMRRGGHGSVLEGDRSVNLVNGKASLGNVRFSEGSSGTRSREFVLAARIDMSEKIEGLRVEEAFMEPPITVLVERSEANEKSSIPMLNDKVCRLNGIGKDYSKRLKLRKISTVQDFLKALNRDEDELRQILKMKSDKFWKVLVGHARECDLTDKHELKSYMVAGENVILFFNCIHDNVGAEFNGLYIAKDKFNPVQKALVDSLKKQAYNELEGIDFQYVMIDCSPAKISANVNAAGSSSIPMSGASPRNTPDHHAHAVSQGENCNAAGPSASEPSPPDQHYTHQNQGVTENRIPEGDAIRPQDTATTDVELDSFWATVPESDPLDQPIYTPFGPDPDLFTPGGQFQDFSPPEEPIEILSTAPSGSETPMLRSMNLYNSAFPGLDSDLFTSGDQFQTSPPEEPRKICWTAPSGSGGGN